MPGKHRRFVVWEYEEHEESSRSGSSRTGLAVQRTSGHPLPRVPKPPKPAPHRSGAHGTHAQGHFYLSSALRDIDHGWRKAEEARAALDAHKMNCQKERKTFSDRLSRLSAGPSLGSDRFTRFDGSLHGSSRSISNGRLDLRFPADFTREAEVNTLKEAFAVKEKEWAAKTKDLEDRLAAATLYDDARVHEANERAIKADKDKKEMKAAHEREAKAAKAREEEIMSNIKGQFVAQDAKYYEDLRRANARAEKAERDKKALKDEQDRKVREAEERGKAQKKMSMEARYAVQDAIRYEDLRRANARADDAERAKKAMKDEQERKVREAEARGGAKKQASMEARYGAARAHQPTNEELRRAKERAEKAEREKREKQHAYYEDLRRANANAEKAKKEKEAIKAECDQKEKEVKDREAKIRDREARDRYGAYSSAYYDFVRREQERETKEAKAKREKEEKEQNEEEKKEQARKRKDASDYINNLRRAQERERAKKPEQGRNGGSSGSYAGYSQFNSTHHEYEARQKRGAFFNPFNYQDQFRDYNRTRGNPPKMPDSTSEYSYTVSEAD